MISDEYRRAGEQRRKCCCELQRRWYELKGELGHFMFVDFLITLHSGEVHRFRKTDIKVNQHHAGDAEQETYKDIVNGVQTTYPC